MFDVEHGIALHTMQGNRPHLAAMGKSHGFSPGVAGTWHIFSGSDGECSSKLMFVQQHHDSCPVSRDTSVFPLRLGRVIGSPLEVKREIQVPFPVATGVLGFLPIFKKSQESSPLEALNSASLSSCQSDVWPLVEMRWGTGLSLGSAQGIQRSLHLG